MIPIIIGASLMGLPAIVLLLGGAKRSAKDFKTNSKLIALLFILFIGLAFIPAINFGNVVYLNIGGTLLIVTALLYLLFSSKVQNLFVALFMMIVIAGVFYMIARLVAMAYPTNFFAYNNYVYALVAGVVTFLLCRNAKYCFIVGSWSILLFDTALFLTNYFMKGGVSYALGGAWQYANMAISIVTALTLNEVVRYALARSKPSKLSYNFEADRMRDYD